MRYFPLQMINDFEEMENCIDFFYIVISALCQYLYKIMQYYIIRFEKITQYK